MFDAECWCLMDRVVVNSTTRALQPDQQTNYKIIRILTAQPGFPREPSSYLVPGSIPSSDYSLSVVAHVLPCLWVSSWYTSFLTHLKTCLVLISYSALQRGVNVSV